MPEFHDDLTPELKDVASQLSPIGQRILEMWFFHRPDLVSEWQKEGKLLSLLIEKSQRSKAMAAELQAQGLTYEQAWEFVKSEWPLPDAPELELIDPQETERPLDWA